MPTIKCKNDRNEKGTIKRCSRFFVFIPDCVVDALKAHPGEKIVNRCPTCPSYQRWAAVYYDRENGLVWETIEKPDSEQFDKELQFDMVMNSKQVG